MSETVEWIVALRMPPHCEGGLSLHQCPTCYALVVEDFMADHADWHATPPAAPDPTPRRGGEDEEKR